MNLAIQLVTLLSAALIFLKIEPMLNRMGHACRLSVRFALSAMAIGSAGVVLIVTQGYVPPVWVSLLLGGLACMLVVDRRRVAHDS